jgi:Acetyltransferase (isoleucine patch superfamily)
MKKIIKIIFGRFMCFMHGIRYSKGLYLGKGIKCVNAKNIQLAENVQIRPDCSLFCNQGVTFKIGKGTDIGCRSRISIANHLEIGSYVLTGPNVFITDCDHEYRDITIPIMHQGIVKKDNKVIIKDNAWIGTNVVIIGNVTIGKGSVIGANSVVTKNIPDYCVAVGSPCRIIKRYKAEENDWK